MFTLDGIKKYFMNTFWLLSEQVYRAATNIILGILIARYLAPMNYGSLNYAISFASLFACLCTLSRDEILVREFVNSPDEKNTYLGTGFVLRLAGAGCMFLLTLSSFIFFKNDSVTRLMIIIIASGNAFMSLWVINYYFQSQIKAKYFAWSSSLAFTVSSLTKIALLIYKAPVLYFAIAFALEISGCAIFLLFFYLYREKSILNWRFSGRVAKKLLSASWPLLLSTFAITIYMRIDQIMVKQMINSTANGYYSVAVRLAELWYFVPMAVSTSFFPAILASKKESEEQFKTRLQLLYDAIIWCAIIVSIVLMFFGPWAITFFYGEQYSESGDILVINIWAGVFVSFSLVRNLWIIAENLQKYTSLFVVIGAITNITLNYFLIPVYGPKGCAVATLISQLVSSYICPLLFKPTRECCFMFHKALFPVHLISYTKSLLAKRIQG